MVDGPCPAHDSDDERGLAVLERRAPVAAGAEAGPDARLLSSSSDTSPDVDRQPVVAGAVVAPVGPCVRP